MSKLSVHDKSDFTLHTASQSPRSVRHWWKPVAWHARYDWHSFKIYANVFIM